MSETNAQPGKLRARASRLRKKLREGIAITTEDADFLASYNKTVYGSAEPELPSEESIEETTVNIESEKIEETDISVSEEQKESESAPIPGTEEQVSKPKETKPSAKRVEMIPVGSSGIPVCKIEGCPCKRKGAGVFCPVLKRKVYPNFGRDQSAMYARGFFGLIKMIFEIFTQMKPAEVSEDAMRTVCMGIESLQKNWDQLAAISDFVNPIFALVAMAGYVKHTVNENRKPRPKELPA